MDRRRLSRTQKWHCCFYWTGCTDCCGM